MGLLYDPFVFQFWQRIWFEALQRTLMFHALQRADLNPNPLDAVSSRSAKLRRYRTFPSDYVAARNVDVWVPPEYEEDRNRRFPVIYMHDGQNLFDPKSSFIGIDWGIDEAMRDLVG